MRIVNLLVCKCLINLINNMEELNIMENNKHKMLNCKEYF